MNGEDEVQGEQPDGEEHENGTREVVKLHQPLLPSPAEREEHALTHVPFRSWCEHCVKGRGEEAMHFKSKEQPEQLEVHMDFCFPGEETSNKKLTILVVRERKTRMTMSSVAPSKSSGEFLAKRVLAFMREIGADKGDITVKTDQEPAMKAIVNEVARHRAEGGGGRMIQEHSPVGDSKGNGIIERAVKSVVGQMRVMRSAIESRVNAKLDPDHPVFAWIAEHASVLLNRFEVGKDGRSAYERCKMKTSKTLGLEFGEAILWKRRPVAGHLAKLTSLWDDGVYLGMKSTTGEIVVGNKQGVWKTRTVRRKPEDQRWSVDNMSMIVGVPWRRNDEEGKKDDDEMKGGVIKLDGGIMEDAEKSQVRQVVDIVPPKAFHTRREDYEKYGYTRGCAGCRSLLTGTTRQKHSVACRSRMEKEMIELERVQASKKRREDFLDKATAAEEANRKKEKKEDGDVAMKEPEVSSALAGAEVASGSGLTPQGRKRAVEDDAWGDLAARIKRRATSVATPTNESTVQVGGDAKRDNMDIGEMEVNVEEDHWDTDESNEIEDTNEQLDPEAVKGARAEEIEFMRGLGVWEDSTLQECVQMTGKPPITTRWVDVNKGRGDEILIRSRLVARDFKVKGDDKKFDVFAAMPPLEIKRMLFRMAMVGNGGRGDEGRGPIKLMFVDVKKAHLNGKVKEDEFEYIRLPEEAGGGVGRLKRWIYGMRQAASAWETDYADNLQAIGSRRGRAAPTAFVNLEKGVRLVVWGDDFTFLGRDRDLKEAAEQMKKWYEIKVRAMLGPEAGDDKDVRILGRVLKWEPDCLTYRADERHAMAIWAGLGLQPTSKGLDSPLLKEECDAKEDDEVLDEKGAKSYRRLAAIANYLALDRPDLQYAVSVLGRTMSRPTQRSWANLKRVGRYLLSHPAAEYRFERVPEWEVSSFVCYSDSDWAGCRASRRSTSGGLITLGGGVVRSWSNRQATIALSSAEAEYYAATKTAAEAIAMQSFFQDLGWPATLMLKMDASAARAMATRQGVGRVRHLEVRHLWLQEVVRRGAVQVRQVPGRANPADVLTKPSGHADMAARLLSVKVVVP